MSIAPKFVPKSSLGTHLLILFLGESRRLWSEKSEAEGGIIKIVFSSDEDFTARKLQFADEYEIDK